MRSKLLVVCGVALISALTLVAATQPWVTFTLEQGAATVSELELAGQGLNPTLSPVAVAGLAAALALTIAGRVFRYILGVLLVALGVGIAMVAAGFLADPVATAATPLSEITGITGSAQALLIAQTVVSLWPVITLVLGCFVSVLGLVVLCVSHQWLQGGRKYQSAADVKESSQANVMASGSPQVNREPDRISDWELLSEGTDPSGDPGTETR